MWLPSIALGRLLAFAALGLAAAAVVLGRHNPAPPEVRHPATPRHRPICNLQVSSASLDPCLGLLDAETGSLVRVPLAGTDLIRLAACSPWRDGRGRTHVAGVWKELDGGMIRRMGLARCALPGAEVLDRIELDILPQAPPCWPPAPGAWIVFAGTDGRLYRLSFEGAARAPQPLAWRCPPPWGGRLAFLDPTWPCDPRFAATVVVALRPITSDGEPQAWVDLQLWWLRLDADGTAIEAAGRLIAGPPSGGHEEIATERLPALASTPGGDLALAYMARRSGESEFRLRLAPVTIDAATGAPCVRATSAVEVAGGRAPSLPAFSGDGRWVYSFADRSPPAMQAQRSSVVESLAGRSTGTADLDPVPPGTRGPVGALARGPIALLGLGQR